MLTEFSISLDIKALKHKVTSSVGTACNWQCLGIRNYPCDTSHSSWSFSACFSQLKDNWKILFCFRKLDWFLTDASNFRILASEINVINSFIAFIKRGIQVEGGKEKHWVPDSGSWKEERADFPSNAITGQLRYECFSIINDFIDCSISQQYRKQQSKVLKSTCTHKVPPIRIVLLQLVLNRTVADVWRRHQDTLVVNEPLISLYLHWKSLLQLPGALRAGFNPFSLNY